MPDLLFTPEQRDTLYAVIRARRDMRHFLPQRTLDPQVLDRLLAAAHAAPSVGFMQPWRFVRVADPTLRQALADEVEQERQATAEALPEARRAAFLKLKIEGVRECAELLALIMPPDDGTLLGRRSMPREMALASAGCAVQNMWLAARAENLGLGWVSVFDPQRVAQLLACPAGAHPLALLCIGPVEQFYPAPMLALEGWRQGRPLADMVGTDRYPDSDHTRG